MSCCPRADCRDRGREEETRGQETVRGPVSTLDQCPGIGQVVSESVSPRASPPTLPRCGCRLSWDLSSTRWDKVLKGTEEK